MELLTLAEERLPKPGCPDWASAGVWAFAAAGVVPPDPPGLEQQLGAAGWWPEPSAAASRPATAVWWAAGRASPAAVGRLFSGLSAAAGTQTVVSDSEDLDQRTVSGREGLPGPVAASERPRGSLWWSRRRRTAEPAREVGLEAADAAETGAFAGDHLEKRKDCPDQLL